MGMHFISSARIFAIATVALTLAGFHASEAQQANQQAAPAAQPARTQSGGAIHYKPSRFSKRAEEYYRLIWGVDSLTVKYAESGEMIRFSYRILDPAKAKLLNDKKVAPSLVDPQAGVKLVIPSLENVGQLRQSMPPEAGKSYWMAFSNKGRFVKRGDHVSVIIGDFHADGLIVD